MCAARHNTDALTGGHCWNVAPLFVSHEGSGMDEHIDGKTGVHSTERRRDSAQTQQRLKTVWLSHREEKAHNPLGITTDKYQQAEYMDKKNLDI